MMDNRGIGDNSSQRNVSRHQFAVTTQLFKAATTMHHIDELFLWLCRAVVQTFSVQVVQIWATQTEYNGQNFTQLRTIVHQDNSLPEHVTVNNQVAAFAEYMLSLRRDYTLDIMGKTFSQHQATLLGRYGLHYCSGYYLSSNGLLPPTSTDLSPESVPTPLAAAVLLFLQQSLLPEQQGSIGLILRQAVQLAGNRGLLLLGLPQQRSVPALSELIPHRHEDAELMKSSNPLAGSDIISDKRARRLYVAIDGRKSLEELSATTHMNTKEVNAALQILLTQHRVQLYDSEGQRVDRSLFLNDR